MNERSISINVGDAAFYPVSHYASPAAVLGDAGLSVAEKRLILSSWASDMYVLENQPAWRKVPGLAQPIRLADILGALRRLDQEDQPPRPRGGAAMRLPTQINLNAHAGSPDQAVDPRLRELQCRSPGPGWRARFSRDANVRRYRKLLATRLSDHERRYVEQRLAEELAALPERRGFARVAAV